LWPPPSVAFGATFPRKRERDPTAPSERAERVFFALCPNEPKRAHSSDRCFFALCPNEPKQARSSNRWA